MKLLISILLLLSQLPNVSAQSDTLQVFFDTDDPFLNKLALLKLEQSFIEVSASSQVLVIGYADYRGDTYYNDMLSMRRATSVASYFENKGLDKKNIKLVYGKGEIKRPTEKAGGYASDRRVDVVLMNEPTESISRRGTTKRTSQTQTGTDKDKTLDDIKTMEVGEALVLDNINFYLNSSRIVTQSYPSLEQLFSVMKNNPRLIIQIEGHICCTETNEGVIGNMALILSQERARAIYDFLLNKGIAKERMRYAGFGRTRPRVAVEKTEADRLQNRRVEIRILAK